jgi:hypothetical protein
MTNKVKFNLGQVVATPAALDTLTRVGISGYDLLSRHAQGDWGNLDDEDRQANDNALKYGSRLLSSYLLSDGSKVWIITEAADDQGKREATTILLPEDY